MFCVMCDKVSRKLYLYDLGMEVPKFIKTLLNVGLWETEVVNLLLSLLILMSRNDIEFSLSVSEVNMMFLWQTFK